MGNKLKNRNISSFTLNKCLHHNVRHVLENSNQLYQPGNTSMLVCVDFFSKFTFLKPMKDAKARAVVDYIEREIFLVFGAPRVILVDNGPQYISDEFKKLCQKYGVSLRHNIRYTPRNNPTERYNQTVETMIRSYVQANQKTWDQRIPEIQAALRTGVSEVTGYSPQFVVFGEELKLDGRDHQFDGNAPEVEASDRAVFVATHRRRQALFEDIRARMQEAHVQNKRRYDLRRRVEQFPVGTTVWRRNFVLSDAQKAFSRKLAPRWVGPFSVKQRIGQVSYLLEDGEGNESGPYHVEQLKRHVPRGRQEAPD